VATIVASACAAEPCAAYAPVKLVTVRPVLAGVRKLSGDVRPRLCRIPASPDVDEAADDVNCNGDARPCSAAGTVAVNCDSMVWVFVAADAPVACATAAAWLASPPGFVAGTGAVNGVKVVELAEAPA
jgi:hypothetical protein